MKITILILLIMMCSFDISVAKDIQRKIQKPIGVFTSYSNKEYILNNDLVKGILVSIKWNQLEYKEGKYNFSIIDSKVKKIKKHNKSWSLAILAGPHSPKYLKRRAEFFLYNSAKGAKIIPKYWDGNVQESIRRLMVVLGRRYNNDASLKLVYVPQMTPDGITAQFKSIKKPYKELYDAGFTKKHWISATIESAIYTATSFSKKAIAVEVREVAGDFNLAKEILTTLFNDKNIGNQIGATIWWLSGKTDYQQNIFNLLKNYEGDIYAHAIGSSNQSWKFDYKGYHYLFWQIKELGARYLFVYNYELKNNTSNSHLKNFNKLSNNKFNPEKKQKTKIIGSSITP